MNISFIVPCFNDQHEMAKTVHSIISQSHDSDEVIVIDSSFNKNLAKNLLNKYSKKDNLIYRHTPPKGIYPAQNYGIKIAKNEWIHIINSADYLLDNARKEIAKAIFDYGNKDLLVFSQMVTLNNKKVLIYTPDKLSIWPHQSILVKRDVHNKLGLYDESLKFTADQMFLFKARKKFSHVIIPFVLSSYDLSGASSKFSIKQCSELFKLGRSRELSLIKSMTNAYLFPVLSKILAILIGNSMALKVKFRLRGMKVD